MRKHGRRDANHGAIVGALRKVGAKVLDIADHGDDYPDLVVAFRGHVIAMEIKNPKGKNKLSAGQGAWLECWPGETAVVRSVDEAIQVVVGRLR